MRVPIDPSSRRSGFTLLEMLVVLIILTLVARTAVLSLDYVAEDEWRASTIAAMEAAEDAILGRPGLKQPSGLPWIEGFVADVGRLPEVKAENAIASGEWFRELWSREGLPTFELQMAAGDPEVKLPVGWRGPYLRLGVGQTGWFDGYGEPFVPWRRTEDGNAVLASDGDPIHGIFSFAKAGGEFVDDILVFDGGLVTEFVVDEIDRSVGDVTVTVVPAPDGGSNLFVRIYGPRNGNLETLQQVELDLSSSNNAPTWTFSDLPVGHRVIRAYQAKLIPNQVGGKGSESKIGGLRSPVTPVTVVPGGVPVIIELEIHAP